MSMWSHRDIIFVRSPYAAAKLSINQVQLAFTNLALCTFYAAMIYIINLYYTFYLYLDLLFTFKYENLKHRSE